jgi:hypothetical protein
MLLRPLSPLLFFVSFKFDVYLKTLGGDIPVPLVYFKANNSAPVGHWLDPW